MDGWMDGWMDTYIHQRVQREPKQADKNHIHPGTERLSSVVFSLANDDDDDDHDDMCVCGVSPLLQNNHNVPSAVKGWNSISIILGMLQELEEIVTRDNSRRNNIGKRHDDDDDDDWTETRRKKKSVSNEMFRLQTRIIIIIASERE
jgi:hypothetical protein